MPKVSFDHTVKYRGNFYGPNEPIDVNKDDAESLIKLGAQVIEKMPGETKKTRENAEIELSDTKK